MTRAPHDSSSHPEPATAWSPPTHAPFALMPAGVWWDAVRVPYAPGWSVVRRLGEACGGVIGDPYRSWLYWLVPPGSEGFRRGTARCGCRWRAGCRFRRGSAPGRRGRTGRCRTSG
ncbi:hypothetical protein [Streptomyces smyrnaeus]|uniref:hypothetical protein n=1 Tax=Streptomyces smyrnaeus TaxID=1387713 RepID=UPI0033FD032D